MLSANQNQPSFHPIPKARLSADGAVVVFPDYSAQDRARLAALEDGSNDSAKVDLFHFEYKREASPELVSGAYDSDFFFMDDAANIITWRNSNISSVANLETGEVIELTRSGYSHCQRGCSRGSEPRAVPIVSGDGSRVVFAEYVSGDDITTDSSLLKYMDVETGIIAVALDPVDDRSTSLLSVFSFDVSDDGQHVVTEVELVSTDANNERVEQVVIMLSELP